MHPKTPRSDQNWYASIDGLHPESILESANPTFESLNSQAKTRRRHVSPADARLCAARLQVKGEYRNLGAEFERDAVRDVCRRMGGAKL